MENYIVINGKKAELTEEQLKQLGINVEVKKETPFTRHSNTSYWLINTTGYVVSQYDCNDDLNNAEFDNVNYFNDCKFAKQVALQQLLYRKLLKYAYENDAEDCEWNGDNLHYCIVHDNRDCGRYFVSYRDYLKDISTTYFSKKGVAEQAIKDVVKPFMEEHPEFEW